MSETEVGNAALLLNVNPAQLRDEPFFEADAFPDTKAEGCNREFDAFSQSLQSTPYVSH